MRRLLACLLAAACSGHHEDPCVAGAWGEVAAGELDRPVLSLWGDADELFAVGGGLGSAGLGATALRWDGRDWIDLEPGRPETLWWVARPGGADVWMVGEDGLALRWNGTAFQELPRMTGATLYGVWGAAPDDVWLVGGLPNSGAGPNNDVVLHWNGSSLTADGPPARGGAFFKVWGADAGDLWVVGEGGLVWRRTAAGWTRHEFTRDSLTTVHGCAADEVYAVGGQGVYRWNGADWHRLDDVHPSSGANGVHCDPGGVLVVGNGGMKLRYDRTRWIDETLQPPYSTDYHAAWIAPDGRLWAGGGNFNAPSSSRRFGTLARYCPP